MSTWHKLACGIYTFPMPIFLLYRSTTSRIRMSTTEDEDHTTEQSTSVDDMVPLSLDPKANTKKESTQITSPLDDCTRESSFSFAFCISIPDYAI